MAETVYKNIGLRPMSDLDVLIKKEDLQKVKKFTHVDTDFKSAGAKSK